jgi:hypothetical protein
MHGISRLAVGDQLRTDPGEDVAHMKQDLALPQAVGLIAAFAILALSLGPIDAPGPVAPAAAAPSLVLALSSESEVRR